MNEGEQLKNFIDNQPKSKVSIARELNMSKQNLFGLFKSRYLEEDTKEKMETYFGKKIFAPSAEPKKSSTVNLDHKEKEPLERAIENLTEADLINARNIERLLNLLEHKLGYIPDKLKEAEKEGKINLREKKTGTKAGHS